MSKVAISEEYLTDIADSIREKLDTSDTYKVSEMSEAIDSISTGGGAYDYFSETGDGSNKLNNYIKILPSITITATSMSNLFYGSTVITEIDTITALNCTNMSYAFYSCTNLETIKGLNTSSLTNCSNMFDSCTNLETIPQFDTSSATNMKNMFRLCSNLKNVPVLDISSITSISNLNGMFTNCGSLTDESLDNILKMCIGANITGTLSDLGFTNVYMRRTRVQGLPSYQDFLDAGWTLGY